MKNKLILIIVVLAVLGCIKKPTIHNIVGKYEKLPMGLSTIELPDSLDKSKHEKIIPIDVYNPKSKKINGDVLVLPGWRFSRSRWHMETSILKNCDKMGFRAIFPDMKITVYESKYFSETKMKWSPTPGGEWIRTILIPEIQKKYGLLLKGNRNFTFGLSTGGRGAVMVILQNPGIFIGGATFSGDCNQVTMPEDRLMTAVYGPYDKFKKRWETVDNIELTIQKMKNFDSAIYIGHGKMDDVSPFEQSESLYRTIKKYHSGTMVKFNAPAEAKHDFKYWDSEIVPAFNFFKSVR